MNKFAKLVFSVLFILEDASIIFAAKNNVCTTFEAYNYIEESPDCYYDPDVDLDDPEKILMNHVEKFEKYKMTTDDGYILTVYRIPKKQAKGVILLVHPLTVDALIWIISGNASLAFMLSNAGYDVWLPSYRGTFISNEHVYLKNDSVAYANYSFHELAVHETRIWTDFIKKKTNRSDLVYIGHSMSSGVGVIYSAMYPEEARKSFKVIISMATAYTLNHMLLPLRDIIFKSSSMENNIRKLTEEMQTGIVYDSPVIKLVKKLTTVYPFNMLITIAAGLLTGWTPNEFDPTALPMLLRRVPRGYSMKSYYHFWQIFISGKYQYFDYGEEENLRRYKQKEPPLYPIEKITVPIHIMYSTDDFLTTAEDSEELYERLPKAAKVYGKHKINGLSHLDYHIGKHRVEKVFNHLVKFINRLHV